MTGSAPLVSVVIPTRERADKLRYTLQTVLSQPGDDLEVIVSDNASADETSAVVEAIRDPRLKYFRTTSRLSMCDNWEFAYGKTSGRYVIYVGDDDALAVDALRDARALFETLPSRVYFWESDIYRWPGEGHSAAFVYRMERGDTRRVSLADMVRFSFRWGGLRYQRLPLLYHSFVERSVLESIRTATGRLFHSTQPDVFLAFSIPVFCEEAVRVGHGLSIYGATENRDDTTTIGRAPSAFAEKVERFIREYGDYPLHRQLDPNVPFWVNMIPDAMLVARDFYPAYYADKPFDFDAMWAFLWRYWRFAGLRSIAARAGEFQQYHPFHPARFLAFAAAHIASESRIRVRRFLTPKPSMAPGHACPDDIFSFAQRLRALDGK